jgi:hypothetical protein
VVAAFASIRESAAKEDVPVLLAILPAVPRASPGQENWSSSYHYTDVHRRVGEEARKQGFRVLDLHPGLAQHSPQLLRASPGDDHLSVAGHRLVAELLLPAVLDMASDGL